MGRKQKARDRRVKRIGVNQDTALEAFREGQAAKLAGKTLGHNPYSKNGKDYRKYHSWCRGFTWGTVSMKWV